MSKTAKPKKQPVLLADVIKPGELFVRTTYIRLHRQKHNLTTEEADAKFESDLKFGSIVMHKYRAEIPIYIKV